MKEEKGKGTRYHKYLFRFILFFKLYSRAYQSRARKWNKFCSSKQNEPSKQANQSVPKEETKKRDEDSRLSHLATQSMILKNFFNRI